MRSFNRRKRPKHSNKINPNINWIYPIMNIRILRKVLYQYGLTFPKKTSKKEMRTKYFRMLRGEE